MCSASTPSPFSAQTFSLRQLLSQYGSMLSIPENQRSYVWNKQEFKVLLSDLEDALRHCPPRSSFLGTICLSKTKEQYQIVDGQQRITTFSLILYVLYARLAKQSIPLPPFMKPLLKNTSASFSTISKLIDKLPMDDSEFLDYLLDQVFFAVLLIPAEDQHRFFDDLNSSGKMLEIQELVFNTLCEITEASAVPGKQNDDLTELDAVWQEFLSLMSGDVANAGAEHPQSAQQNLENDEEAAEDSDDTVPPEEPTDAATTSSHNDSLFRQLNFRYFFTAFVRMDYTHKYSNNLYRAMEERLASYPLTTRTNRGIALAQEILTYAHYYALLVSPMSMCATKWFSEKYPQDREFLCALVRFSTLRLGDALPLFMRLLKRNAPTAELTAYLNGIFELYLFARITKFHKLRHSILRQLPGLDMEMHARSGAITRDQVQITLIGSMNDSYESFWPSLANSSALSLLHAHGQDGLLTSLLVAQQLESMLEDVSNYDMPTLCDTFKEIAKNGGFSLEHISAQSNRESGYLQKPGNLALLEKHLNSEANNRPIREKAEVYEKSAFKKHLLEGAQSLYGDTLTPNVSPNDLSARIQTRTETLCQRWVSLFHKVTPATPPLSRSGKAPVNHKLVYMEENPDGTRDWTWYWHNPTRKPDAPAQLKVLYFDDGRNSRPAKNRYVIQGICGNSFNGKIAACTELLIHLFYRVLLEKYAVSPSVYGTAVNAAASVKNASYKNCVSAQSSGRNSKETCFHFTAPNQPDTCVTLHLASDVGTYPKLIGTFLRAVFQQLQLPNVKEEDLPLFYLTYENKAFRDHSGPFFTHHEFLFGDLDEYHQLLLEESRSSKPILTDDFGSSAAAPSCFLSSQLWTLRELSDNCPSLSIPTYQRKYVWSTPQWEHLASSIHQLWTGQSPHLFLGVLLLGEQRSEDGTLMGYEVIDGQQRLSTLSHMFPELGLTSRIHFAHSAMPDALHQGKPPYDGLAAFAAEHAFPENADDSALIDRIQFLTLILPQEHLSRAGELFTTVNGRGRQLTPGEIVKNYILMRASTFYGGNKSECAKFIKNARPMWKDSSKFEEFIAAYLAMREGRAIPSSDLASNIKSRTDASALEQCGLNPDWANLVRLLVDQYPKELSNASPDLTNMQKDLLSSYSLINHIISAGAEDFFTDMPVYWNYYEALTKPHEPENCEDATAMTPAEQELRGELYLHHLVGTHTTLPPLLYSYARWQEAATETEKATRRAEFLHLLRNLTDTFLLCHLFSEENTLKSMNSHMARLCKTLANTTPDLDAPLNIPHVLDAIPADQRLERLRQSMYEDLYSRKTTLALLLAWRCEQACHKEDATFYSLVCRWPLTKAKRGTTRDVPSVEHIHPQSTQQQAVYCNSNYSLLELSLNMAASDKDFSDKKLIYNKSRYLMTQALATYDAVPTEQQLCDRMVGLLAGDRGLTYLRGLLKTP